MKNNTVILKIILTSECFYVAALSTQQLNKNWTKSSMAFKTFGSREEKDDYMTLENNKYNVLKRNTFSN